MDGLINTPGLVQIAGTLIGIASLWIGVTFWFSAKKQKMHDTATIGVNALIGLVFFAIGAGGFAFAIAGQRILRLITNLGA